MEKVKALYQVQTDKLKDEYLKQYDKKEEFRKELVETKKKNIRLNNKILDVDMQIDALKDMLEGNEGG